MLKLKLIDEDGEGPDEDQWDGYPAERSVLLERFGAVDDVVLLSADIHISLASEVGKERSPPAAVVPQLDGLPPRPMALSPSECTIPRKPRPPGIMRSGLLLMRPNYPAEFGGRGG